MPLQTRHCNRCGSCGDLVAPQRRAAPGRRRHDGCGRLRWRPGRLGKAAKSGLTPAANRGVHPGPRYGSPALPRAPRREPRDDAGDRRCRRVQPWRPQGRARGLLPHDARRHGREQSRVPRVARGPQSARVGVPTDPRIDHAAQQVARGRPARPRVLRPRTPDRVHRRRDPRRRSDRDRLRPNLAGWPAEASPQRRDHGVRPATRVLDRGNTSQPHPAVGSQRGGHRPRKGATQPLPQRGGGRPRAEQRTGLNANVDEHQHGTV